MPQLVWLVTGTATGFGEQLVHAILERGDRVIATARNAVSRLQAQKDLGAAILELDVTAPQSELDAKIDEARKIYGKIDVLVNNAGYIEAGFLEEIGDERTRKVCETNAFGALNLTRAILPHLREQRAGVLLFMSSILVWEAIPTSGAYASTKGFTESAVLCLKDEVAAFGIKTCVLIPGHFRTEILSPQKLVYGAKGIADYAEANKMCEAAVVALHSNQPGDPRAAAVRIVDAVKSEGGASGKELPSMLPLGQDAVDSIRKRSKFMLDLCDEWETFSRQTTTETVGGA